MKQAIVKERKEIKPSLKEKKQAPTKELPKRVLTAEGVNRRYNKGC
ncbi:MAG: hypothetical protein KAR79_04530 [Simkaniaceae bacterium]|nr:hypothetical protein [Simkaniaceae bacterium]